MVNGELFEYPYVSYHVLLTVYTVRSNGNHGLLEETGFRELLHA